MGKISSGDINGNSNISLEEKEKVLRELQMKYENNQETLRTIAAQNKNLENQLNDKKYDDLETKLSKQQMAQVINYQKLFLNLKLRNTKTVPLSP